VPAFRPRKAFQQRFHLIFGEKKNRSIQISQTTSRANGTDDATQFIVLQARYQRQQRELQKNLLPILNKE
jgi:hypothetical protein